jgi:hypothetical protein
MFRYAEYGVLGTSASRAAQAKKRNTPESTSFRIIYIMSNALFPSMPAIGPRRCPIGGRQPARHRSIESTAVIACPSRSALPTSACSPRPVDRACHGAVQAASCIPGGTTVCPFRLPGMRAARSDSPAWPNSKAVATGEPMSLPHGSLLPARVTHAQCPHAPEARASAERGTRLASARCCGRRSGLSCQRRRAARKFNA